MILFNSDDFGLSKAVNEAVVKAHVAGTLHSASLMMGEEGTEEAVRLARKYPSLRVGLHVVLVDGKSVLPSSDIPNLVDSNRNFPKDPAFAWLKYFFQPFIFPQLEKEVQKQFEAFGSTGLKLSHVDGHHHFHIHPRVFKVVAKLAKKHGASWVRLPREDIKTWKKAASNRPLWKWLHGLIYYGLTSGKKKVLARKGLLRFDDVFGILETFSMSKEYVLNILKTNSEGNHEFYFHPGASWNRDLEVLLDPDIIKETKKIVIREDL